MKKAFSLLLLTLSVQINAQSAQDILVKTLEAMGGQTVWQKMQYIHLKGAGHKYWLEQSENPNGPFITSYELIEETRAVHQHQLHRKETSNHFQSGGNQQSEIMVNGQSGTMKFGDRVVPIPYQLRTGHDEWMRYAPEKLLFGALKNSPVLEGTRVIDGTSHFIVSFVKDQLKHSLYINSNNFLLGEAGLETHLPSDIFNYPWGKFETRVHYALQWLYPGNIRYPAQWDIYKLGKHFRSLTIQQINFKPEVSADLFKLPENFPAPSTPRSVNKTPLDTSREIEVAEGIYTIPGMWYVGHIVQEDGILLIESPISSGYNQQHLDYLKKRYPNKPVKGVFSTSDAWPHIGGVRSMAAADIPIYTHTLNEPIIRKVLAADHGPEPDAYQENKRDPQFRLIKEGLRLEDSQVPVEVLPINGEGGARMIALYFPKQEVLYASDLVQKSRGQFFSMQYLSEVKALVDRKELNVKTVFAMHTSPVTWSEVLKALKENQP